jgi:hypothetical protein
MLLLVATVNLHRRQWLELVDLRRSLFARGSRIIAVAGHNPRDTSSKNAGGYRDGPGQRTIAPGRNVPGEQDRLRSPAAKKQLGARRKKGKSAAPRDPLKSIAPRPAFVPGKPIMETRAAFDWTLVESQIPA